MIFNKLQHFLHDANGIGLNQSLAQAESEMQRQIQELKAREVLTLDEAAQYLRIEPQALLDEVMGGTVPGCQLGGQWRFSVSALSAAMNRHSSMKKREQEVPSIFNENLIPPFISEEVLKQIELDITPPRSWEYYDPWMICIEIRRLAIDLQEKMYAGVLLHELVTASTLDRLAEKWGELWHHTYYKDEDLQYRYFDRIKRWFKTAEWHYKEFKLFLETRVTAERPEYRLTFLHIISGEMVLKSDTLPVQADWAPIEAFWQDSRRYDYAKNSQS
jgi:hypothetical protein